LKRHGVEIDFVKNRNGIILLEDIEQALTPRTRLLSISHVQFLNGFKIDLEEVGDLCKTKGIIFSVDPIQSAGALQIDVKKANVDFISCGGHKWLMSPQGSAFIFLTEELQERIQQAYVGWTSVANPWNLLDYRLELQPTARRYENGTMNFMGICGMHAALSLLLEVGIETIEGRILELTDFLVAQLSDAQVYLATPVHHEHRSGIVSFKSDKSQAVYDKLLSEKIELAVREGLVRFSPHFYNTEEEIDKAVEIIKGMQ
jgi:cysteine desulfurase/selenocysteine lyase